LSEEWHQDLKNSYRPEEDDFPQVGNEKEELLAYQIDQRVTSFMYSPGMQRLLDTVDKNIMAGTRVIEEGTHEQITALDEQHHTDREQLVKKLGETRTALWGLGGLMAAGGLAFAAAALWPKIREYISNRVKTSESEELEELPGDEEEELEEAEGEGIEEEKGTKSYFKWKRDRGDEIKWE
jgi:hypothetical protein